MANEAGKGSKQRPTNYEAFSDAFDRIFGKKKLKCTGEQTTSMEQSALGLQKDGDQALLTILETLSQFHTDHGDSLKQ